jgi:hypothetical protein
VIRGDTVFVQPGYDRFRARERKSKIVGRAALVVGVSGNDPSGVAVARHQMQNLVIEESLSICKVQNSGISSYLGAVSIRENLTGCKRTANTKSLPHPSAIVLSAQRKASPWRLKKGPLLCSVKSAF